MNGNKKHGFRAAFSRFIDDFSYFCEFVHCEDTATAANKPLFTFLEKKKPQKKTSIEPKPKHIQQKHHQQQQQNGLLVSKEKK